MDSQPPNFEDLQDRLARLEKENRRFKQLGAVVLAIAAVIVVMGQAPAKKTVEANEFILRDDNGNIRARLFVTAKYTTNWTIPGMNQPVPVTQNPEPMLALYDEKGEGSGMLDEDSLIFRKSHVSIAGGMLAIGDKTSGVVVNRYNVGLFDEQGFVATLGRTALVTPRTGETQMTSAASLVLFDKNKNVIWKAP